ncbi:nodulin 21-related protein [Algibacter lectus]|uniref:Nodulin 21-related protein n=1 Tax=Algibacter lectus TaxID=221126 RepID=A0A090X5Y4_9FLAO|nr:nodulin 21-related protein [Algibacter lectus]
MTEAKPLQAALSSGISFTVGGFLPVLVAFIAPLNTMEYIQYVFAILFLAVLGAISAKTGGAKPLSAILRVTFWGGTLAMGGLTAVIGGALFNTNLA